MSIFPPHPNLLLRASHGRFVILPAGLQAPGLQRFAVFSGGLGFAAGAPQFDAALQAAGRDGGMLAIRGFYNQWRFGNTASLPDQDLLKRLARDVRAGFLATFYLPDEDFAGFTLTGDDGQAVPAPSGPVSGWSVKQKLVATFEAVPDDLGTAAQAEFRAFISPANLATMAGILVFIAGVQTIPGADAFVDGLIIALAWAQFGWAGLLAARDFVEAVAQAGQAKSDDDIRLAAKLAAAALVSLGLVVFLKKLTGKVRQSGGLKGEEEPNSGSAPNAGTQQTRPSWRKSEQDVGKDLGSKTRTQVSYKNGNEVPYGTAGSVRPDFVKGDSTASFEVKNYDVAKNSNGLINTVSQQAVQRQANLPAGMQQRIIIDIRGQSVSNVEKDIITKSIVQNSNGAVSPTSIFFKDQ